MIQLLKKSDQFNTAIFNGNFVVNKPVASGTKATVKPYSNLFYWSHGVTSDDCEFGLHPHEGFEIMTFILEGQVNHYDTATKVWTPLQAGDFQIIQSNSGIQHQERITKGTRSFQIWFDPNFYKAIQEKPAYKDYYSKDFQAKMENGIATITYIGDDSISTSVTPHLRIKKLIFNSQTQTEIALNENSSYTFYVLNGQGTAEGQAIVKDDAIRITDAKKLAIDFQGELFYIETPTHLEYTPIWL